MAQQTKILPVFILLAFFLGQIATSRVPRKLLEEPLDSKGPNDKPNQDEIAFAESQQVSHITTLKYLPVETIEGKPREDYKHHKLKPEEVILGNYNEAHNGHQKHEKSHTESHTKSTKPWHFKESNKQEDDARHNKDHSWKEVQYHKADNTKGSKNGFHKEKSGKHKKESPNDTNRLKESSKRLQEDQTENKRDSKENIRKHGVHGKRHPNSSGSPEDKHKGDQSFGHNEKINPKGVNKKHKSDSSARTRINDRRDSENVSPKKKDRRRQERPQSFHPIQVDSRKRKHDTQNDDLESIEGSHSANSPVNVTFGQRLRFVPNKKISSKKPVSQTKRKDKQKLVLPIQNHKQNAQNVQKTIKTDKQNAQNIQKPNRRTIPIARKIRKKTEDLEKKKHPPISLFVKNDLKKNHKDHKILKTEKGMYAGHLQNKEKSKKKQKDSSMEQINEIEHDESPNEKGSATTVHKPVVLTKPFKTSGESKDRVPEESKKSKKLKTIAVPNKSLKEEKSQQASSISRSELSPSASSKGGGQKSKEYKVEKAQESGHHKASGEKVKKGGHEVKSSKGSDHRDHGKKHKSKFVDKGGKEEKGHNDQKHHHGKHERGEKASKGHANGEKGHHHKGHSDKGFKNSHHKLEYASKKKFYHDEEDKKHHNVFDDFDSFFAKKKKENLKAHNQHSGLHGSDYDHEGHHFDEFFENFQKGTHGDYGHGDFHHHFHLHDHKGHQDKSHGQRYRRHIHKHVHNHHHVHSHDHYDSDSSPSSH